MERVVIGVHETDCFTYIIDERGCVLLRIKGEFSFKLNTAENIDSYVHGLSNGLHREVLDGYTVLIIYFDQQRMSVSFQTADKLSQKGCPYVSVLAAAHALVPVSEEFLKRGIDSELWEILGELYQVRCYNGELSLAAANSQRGQAVRSVSAGEMCFFASYRSGTDTDATADGREQIVQIVRSLWEQYNSKENVLLDEIYVLMGMEGKMKSQRQLLKRLSCAYALYQIPKSERSGVTDEKLAKIANDKRNPYSYLMWRLNNECQRIYNLYIKIKGINGEEWNTVKKEIWDYIMIDELGDKDRLQDIKDELIAKKLYEIWKERDQVH